MNEKGLPGKGTEMVKPVLPPVRPGVFGREHAVSLCYENASWIALDPALLGRVYAVAMGRTGLCISELARRGGTMRKALRLYEAAGILPASRRTAAGYRIYDSKHSRF